MEQQQRFLTMRDGQQIFVRTFEPEHVIGHVHILHGMGEHSGRYEEFAKMLCTEGYYVSMHDHRGHGHTAQGTYGHFADERGFHHVVVDVLEVLLILRKTVTAPLTLFGHSMGSFIARRFIQLYSDQITACIICGTGVTSATHLAGNQLANTLAKAQGKQIASPLMNSLSFGSFNKAFSDTTTEFDWLSRDIDEVQKYIEDEMCGFIPSHQFYADLTEGLLLIHRKDEMARTRTDLPVLFISGSDDPVGNFGKGVFKVAKRMVEVGMENVTVHLFEEMRHEILNEKNKQHVHDVVLRWLKNVENKL
ncbi:alpha/beta hydrolase [Metasolibacillus sp. FSL K6-0083]|uniref:alpha/beta hydrolase n=1 Tax=Metasolibacillus sp. FSL K6-0083 TaxID=2921416 RepID=UPI003159C169